MLRDYTHHTPPQTGFQNGVPEQMARDVKLDKIEWQKFVCLAYDEMKIKEGLVYNKYTDQLVGFVALDDVNDHILEFEHACRSPDCTTQKPDLATHMLVLLVQGIFTGLKFPLAQFATMNVASHQLYPIVSDASYASGDYEF